MGRLQLESFPLTANGKVDRRGLPTSEKVRHDGEASYVAPRDQSESSLWPGSGNTSSKLSGSW